MDDFFLTVEVVPPVGSDAASLLDALGRLDQTRIDGYSVATNPVAKPRMCAMALSALIQQHTGTPAILHCTTRDHNRLSLQGLLWGAKAMGIATVLATTGDYIALGDRAITSTVQDLDVLGLIRMARASDLRTGVVFDPHLEGDGLKPAAERLVRKVEAGAQYLVTQPLYDRETADTILAAIEGVSIPKVMGILPLRTPKHAAFLHNKVAGITVPAELRRRMQQASDPLAAGIENAREMLAVAREHFAGACIMPPFDHYEVLPEIMA
jgi:methylenetetrahydrofolate reductase (NADPH)